MDQQVNKLREFLRDAKRVAVITGAGVSAESGVPTFRGKEGLWRDYDPTVLATPQAFREDPKLVWEWYDWRRGLIATCLPNPAHEAIAKLEASCEDFLLITQNVDGLHHLAGSQNIAEMHGNIWRVRRSAPPHREWEDRTHPLADIPPRDHDGTLLRPAVVWYGEMLPSQETAKVERFFSDPPDLVIVVGTSAQITWLIGYVQQFRATGIRVVEVNLEPTGLSGIVDLTIRGRAGAVLPKVL